MDRALAALLSYVFFTIVTIVTFVVNSVGARETQASGHKPSPAGHSFPPPELLERETLPPLYVLCVVVVFNIMIVTTVCGLLYPDGYKACINKVATLWKSYNTTDNEYIVVLRGQIQLLYYIGFAVAVIVVVVGLLRPFFAMLGGKRVKFDPSNMDSFLNLFP